jgi:hypothetical protein
METTIKWKKQAAAQGQSLEDVEKAFLDSAYMAVQSKAAPIMKAPYRVGFEIVHHNDDNTRIVGIFVFRVGKDLYFAPVFFINGNIKGTDLFYRHSTKSFVPLNERWLEYLISLSETTEGKGVPISERINTRRQLNLTNVVAPPTSVNGGYGLSKGASVETVDQEAVKKLAHTAWDEIKDTAFPGEPTESILRKFIVNDGGFAAIKKLANTAKHEPEFAEALMLASKPENYMPELEYTKKASEPEPVLTIHLNPLHNTNVKEASEQQILNGYVIEDSRPKEAVNEVIYESNERELQSVTQPGVYSVLMPDGGTREMICGYHRRLLQADSAFGAPNCTPTPVFDAFSSVLPFTLVDTGDNKSIDLDVFPQAKTYRVMGKFVKELTKDLGQEKPEAGKMYRVLNLKTRSFSEPCYVVSVKGTGIGTSEVEIKHCHCDQSKTLIINPDYHDFDRDSRVMGGCCVWVPVKFETEGEGEHKWHHADNSLQLGDLHAVQEFIFREGFVKAAVDHSHDQFMIRTRADLKNTPAHTMNKVAAKLALMTHCALEESDADHVLKQASEKGRFMFYYQPAEGLAVKSGHNLRLPQFPEFYDAMNSDFNVMEQPISRTSVQADRDIPYVEKHRIGDKVTFDAGDNIDSATPMQLYQTSKERGVGSMFEHGVVGALTNTFDSAALIDTYMPDLLSGLDRIGRILFLFYWKPEDFAQAFGSDDQSQLENKLVSNFKSFGDLLIELLQKTKQSQQGSVSLA